jgi:WbqC-like protein family
MLGVTLHASFRSRPAPMAHARPPGAAGMPLMAQPAKRVAIIQSCYVPWKGFFDLIGRCDEYVVLDGVQFAKRHWHNRNRIKGPDGSTRWLTIPVATKGRFTQTIDAVEIVEPWAERHWRTLAAAYGRAAHFDAMGPRVRGWYERVADERSLTAVNLFFLRAVLAELGLAVRVTRDRDYAPGGTKTQRLLDICRTAGATHYLSGPSARGYFDEDLFARAGVAVEWMTYGPYPVYAQGAGAFVHDVSILDLLFHLGSDAGSFIRPRGEQVPR